MKQCRRHDMFVVRGDPTKPELHRSDIDHKARAFRVAPTGLRLCFRVGLIGIGGGVAPVPLPHHRTYSAYPAVSPDGSA